MLREALENVGVKYTFGIPGVTTPRSTTSRAVEFDHPVLVTTKGRVRSWRRRESQRDEPGHARHRA